MLIERLEQKYKELEPIFISEILDTMNDYSRQRIYQLINEEIEDGKLKRYDEGIYYLPQDSLFGELVPSFSDVITKKYISNNNNIIGILGKYTIELQFGYSTQVPNNLEIISNNASRKVREVKIRDKNIILKKSRVNITNDNVYSYILLEFFNDIDVKTFNDNLFSVNNVTKFIKDKSISLKEIYEIIEYFPAKAIKNLMKSDVFNVLA